MPVAARTATLLAFSSAGATPSAGATTPVPCLPVRARRGSGGVRSPAVRAPAWTIAARSAAARGAVAAGTLRSLAMAAGLGAMLLASTGAAGWAFVAAGQATRSSLAGYVDAPGARS